MKTEREMFEESNNIKPDWSFKFDDELQQYVELDHEMQAQVEEFNEHWDTFRAGWKAAKAQAVPDGFVVVPKEIPKSFDEGLYFYSNSISVVNEHSDGFIPMSDIDHSEIWKLVIEAQEQGHE